MNEFEVTFKDGFAVAIKANDKEQAKVKAIVLSKNYGKYYTVSNVESVEEIIPDFMFGNDDCDDRWD